MIHSLRRCPFLVSSYDRVFVQPRPLECLQLLSASLIVAASVNQATWHCAERKIVTRPLFLGPLIVSQNAPQKRADHLGHLGLVPGQEEGVWSGNSL